MARWKRPRTPNNISKNQVRHQRGSEVMDTNVREKRVFPYAHAQSRVRADGHISATERNFFKRSKVADRGLLRAHQSAKISTSIFGAVPGLGRTNQTLSLKGFGPGGTISKIWYPKNRLYSWILLEKRMQKRE